MKRKMLVVIALVVPSLAWAQDEKKIGGLLAYGTEIESVGIGINAEFPIADSKFSIAPNFIFYIPKEEFGITSTVWELNANANYYFSSSEAASFYGIGGLNYTQVKVKGETFFGDFSSSDSSIGLNLGAGANFNLGKSFTPFAELKYTIGDFDQLVLGAGLKFNF